MLQWKFERRVKHVRPGNVIQMNVDGQKRKCFVIDVFDYFVKARYRSKGKIYETSFTIGELVQAGYEPKGVL